MATQYKGVAVFYLSLESFSRLRIAESGRRGISQEPN